MEVSVRHFVPWAKADCDQCASEFQVTRCESFAATGEVICSDCKDYNKAYQDGFDAAMKERHDQQVDSGDSYEAEDQPYTPQVGEECEFREVATEDDFSYCFFIGKDKKQEVGFFQAKNTSGFSVFSIKIKDIKFEYEFRPLKTERDILIDRLYKDLIGQNLDADKECETVNQEVYNIASLL